jgi:Protein of unknown function (DUF3224)
LIRRIILSGLVENCPATGYGSAHGSRLMQGPAEPSAREVRQAAEVVEPGAQLLIRRARSFVIPGSGTGNLSGLRGEGGFTAESASTRRLTLNYSFEYRGRRPQRRERLRSQARLHVSERLHDLPVANVHEVDAPHRVLVPLAESIAPADSCPIA